MTWSAAASAGKRSATSLWIHLANAGNLQEKRRRASLAAALHIISTDSSRQELALSQHCRAMAIDADSPLDSLWKEYSLAFRDFDDLTLARWLAQTLGQLDGKAWRLSHPLIGAYRLGAQLGHERQIWFKRLASPPPNYAESPCCRAPMLPLLTRDVRESGLVCQHCSETLVPFEEIPSPVKNELEKWALEYGPVHAVAHWDDDQRKRAGGYDRAYERAAENAEALLERAGNELAPKLLEFYAAVVWEDQDECLEVRPEDVMRET